MILQEIANVSSGQKIQESCQIYGLKFCLSLPVTFSVLVNVNQYQIYIHNREIAVFDFFQPNLVYYQFYKNAPLGA